MLRVPELHRTTVLGRRSSRCEGPPADRRLALKDLCHDGMASGLRTRSGTDRERDEQATKPEHVKSDFDRAEGGGSGVERFAAMRSGYARRLYSSARYCCRRIARHPRNHMRESSRGVLCLPEPKPVFRPPWLELRR